VEVCKICGINVDILTNVHTKKHGLTKDEYRLKYGDNRVNSFRLHKRVLNEAEKYEASKFFKRG
jgi:hypothetical protein